MIITNWNDDWKYWEDNSSFELLWGVPDDAEDVCLPHDAMISGKVCPESRNGGYGGYIDGANYIYVKKYFAPEEDKDRAIFLRFGGIYMNSFIYVNGQLAGKHPNGYSSFDIRIDPYLNYGEENEIRVQVRNAAMPNSRWYSGGGIYRDVCILKGEKIRISPEGVFISNVQCDDEIGELEIALTVTNETKRMENLLLDVRLLGPEGSEASHDRYRIIAGSGDTPFVQRMSVHDPKLWDDEHPVMYKAEVILFKSDINGKPLELIDRSDARFGIRQLSLDPARGLRVNGRTVKLRGACIHHESGLLGAATYEAIEYRRISKLKEAGFNAIRMAHHPMAECTLKACDDLGMYVMNEFSDVWSRMKTGYDYGFFFEEWWEKDIDALVKMSYNHPSVIMYSIGNEIPDTGTDRGAVIAGRLAGRIRSLDRTRYTTAGINGIYAVGEKVRDILRDLVSAEEADKYLQGNVNDVMTVLGEYEDKVLLHDTLSQNLEKICSSLDISGYNYMTSRYASDAAAHPERIMVGSETYPTQIAGNWREVKNIPQLIGDFTWAGWDYRGEVAVGVKFYGRDGLRPGMQYPYQLAYCADFDITGIRRPASYYREIVFGLRSKPYIAVQNPEYYGDEVFKTQWTWDDDISSWTWHGYEGKPVKVAVYSPSYEIELFVNGVSCGRVRTGEDHSFRAEFDIKYEPGTIAVAAYDEEGNEVSREVLRTAGTYIAPAASQECMKLGSDRGKWVILNIELQDKDGSIVTCTKQQLDIEVSGGAVLQGFGSGDPKPAYSCQGTKTETFYGRAQAILMRTSDEPVSVIIRDGNGNTAAWIG